MFLRELMLIWLIVRSHPLNSLPYLPNIKSYFRWIPSLVNVYGNEVKVDERVHFQEFYWRRTFKSSIDDDCCFSFSELASRVKLEINYSWKLAPVHEWYDWKGPGTALIGVSRKGVQTALTRFGSGHLRTLRFVSRFITFVQKANGFRLLLTISSLVLVARKTIWSWHGSTSFANSRVHKLDLMLLSVMLRLPKTVLIKCI